MRTTDHQRNQVIELIFKKTTLTSTELAEEFKCSTNWARILLSELEKLQQVRIVGRRDKSLLFALSEVQLIPILNFDTGATPPTVLLEHHANGVSAKELTSALKANITVMECLLAFYDNRIVEATSMASGKPVNKSRAMTGRKLQQDALRAIDTLHVAITSNLSHPNWFNPEVLPEMPRSKYWRPVGALPKAEEPDAIDYLS